MSAKNLDQKGRFRSITVGFRVSPEENDALNKLIKLSGLTKQDYILKKLTDRTIVVQGNPRVYKALKGTMYEIFDRLNVLFSVGKVDEELLETFLMITKIMEGMKGENHGE